MIISSFFFVAQYNLSDLQLDEAVYNKAGPDTFSWDGWQLAHIRDIW